MKAALWHDAQATLGMDDTSDCPVWPLSDQPKRQHHYDTRESGDLLRTGLDAVSRNESFFCFEPPLRTSIFRLSCL